MRAPPCIVIALAILSALAASTGILRQITAFKDSPLAD